MLNAKTTMRKYQETESKWSECLLGMHQRKTCKLCIAVIERLECFQFLWNVFQKLRGCPPDSVPEMHLHRLWGIFFQNAKVRVHKKNGTTMILFSELQCCWETVKLQMLIQQEAKDYVHPLSAGLTQNVLCRTFLSQCCRWLTQSMVRTARSKILFHSFLLCYRKMKAVFKVKFAFHFSCFSQ